MKGLIGKKIGMTSIFNDAGHQIACTVVQLGPCYVTQVKTEDSDGYNAIQLAYGDKKEKGVTKAMKGHFQKAGVSPKSKIVEFSDFDLEVALGDEVSVEIFDEGERVNVAGTSKGKGFQGVVKRYGFKGVNDATHGQHNRQRAPGSIGASSYPSRVFKGMRMAGRTGGKRITSLNLEVIKILQDKNLMLVKGAVPGAKGSYVIVENA